MACLICGSKNAQREVQKFDVPDMYEAYMGIKDVKRTWWQCEVCGHFHQTRNYELAELEKIYESGYREVAFRGKDIRTAFNEIMEIPFRESENKQRAEWFCEHTFNDMVLDIGSGIGVFPSTLKSFGYEVESVEENEISIEFINSLGIKCYDKIPDNKRYWNVSLVHVLEHIEKPDEFLKKVYKVCKRHLFVEVPDAREFTMLPKEHDEFNSCHLWFFTLQNLITLIERNGFTVIEAARKFYARRKLSRILVLAAV